MLFDTHSHLSYAPLDQDEGWVFTRLHDVWVGHTMQIGCDVVSSLSAITLAQKYPWHYASVGLHPVEAQSIHAKYEISKNQEQLKSLIEENRSYVRAIGETGLDNYHLPDTNIEEAQQAQETWFRLQIELAQHYKLPLVIHTRDARERTYDILSEIVSNQYSNIPAIVMHCYSEDIVFAQRLLSILWNRVYFAFGGILTYRSRNEAIQEAAIQIPIPQILLETDAPFLAPYLARKNGAKYNESSYIGEVLDKLAELRNEPRDILEEVIYNNSIRIFCPEHAHE